MAKNYLKESRTYQDLLNTAKKYNIAEYIPGQSFEAHKEKMSAEDYEKGQKLLEYYTAQQNLTNNYDLDTQNVENNQKQQLQENAISKEMTMRYLPEYLKLQGLGGLGVSESSIIEANNNFRNARNSINSDMEARKAELLRNYQENLSNLDTGATKETATIGEKYENARKEEATNLYNSLVNKIDYGEFNTISELEESYNQVKDKLDDYQKSVLEDKIKYFKNNLEQLKLDEEYKTNIGIDQNQSTKDEKIIAGEELIEYNHDQYKLVKRLGASSNEISNNDSFREEIKRLGFASAYDEKIPNGTTITIKCDGEGGDNVHLVKDYFNPFALINWIWGDSNWSIYRKTLTYYNGNWYESEKQ